LIFDLLPNVVFATESFGLPKNWKINHEKELLSMLPLLFQQSEIDISQDLFYLILVAM
jgi:hypothetical protein